MEATSCLDLVMSLYNDRNTIVARLCCDDDSSVRADCRWSNSDYLLNNRTNVLPLVPKKSGVNQGELQKRPDKGKLPGHIPEPLFVADPNHRRKGLYGLFLKLCAGKVEEKATMTRMDATRIGKNFGYMARTLQRRPQCEYVLAAAAVLEHHFDKHDQCGPWCRRKNETAEQRRTSGRYYRNKETDPQLYKILLKTIQRFVTLDKLIEMAHGLDTNMNEAFNQICTWFLPKNKVFAGSGSLENRIAFAVGINSVGIDVFFTMLFAKLGIAVTDNVAHFLQHKERRRATRLAGIRTKTAKLNKNKKKYMKLAANTVIAKREKAKREGAYRTGMNMEDDEDMEGVVQRPPAKKRKSIATLFCEFCGKKGHATKRSGKCTAAADSVRKYNKLDGSLLSDDAEVLVLPEPANVPGVASLQHLLLAAGHESNDADDQDCYDMLRPDDVLLDSDEDEFHDTTTWSDNDDDDDGLLYGAI
jgi:hypothetical protein